MSESPENSAEKPSESLNWVDIIRADEKAQEGMLNPYRKGLLKPGVYVDLTRMTAESWMPLLRARNKAAGKVELWLGRETPEEPPVRITIVSIPEATMADAVGGTILVKADGVEAEIQASVFYNSIKGKDRGMKRTISEGTHTGGWGGPPDDFAGNVG